MVREKDLSTMIKKLLWVFLLIFSFHCIFALGAFSMFGGRNRPDLSWYEVETDYSKIVFSDNLYNIALETAAIADSTYLVLSKTFDVLPDKKVIIYISDQDNIPNGACVMSEYIFIWVNQNDYLKLFTGNHKWLRKVLAHEMVHWFLFYSIEDWLSNLIPISQISFPLNINEGYAQHFSGEDWGLNRGDRYLRTWAFAVNEKISYSWYGGFLYGNGFAFVRYLSEFYGEDKLVELLKFRNNVNLYNFDDAFKKTFKKSFKEMQEEWIRYTKTFYYGEAYLQKVINHDNYSENLTVNSLKPLKSKYTPFDLTMNNDKVLMVTKLAKNQNYQSLIYGNLVVDSLKVDKFLLKDIQHIADAGRFNNISLSQNGRYATYTRYTRHRKGRLAPRVYLYDLYMDKHYNLEEGNFPVVNSLGNVFYQNLDLKANTVYKTTELSSKPLKEVFLSFLPENHIGELSLNPDESILAISIFDQQREFFVAFFNTENSETVDVLSFSAMPQQLLWKSSNEIVVSVENPHTFKLDLFLFNLETKEIIEYDSPPINVFPRFISEIDENLVSISLAELNRDAKSLGAVTFTPKRDNDLEIPVNYYTRWIYNQPKHSIPEDIEPYSHLDVKKYNSLKNIKYRLGLILPTGNGLLGTTVFSEALGKHIFNVSAYVPYDRGKDVFYSFTYLNNSLKPTIQFSAIQTKWFAGMVDDKMIANRLNLVSLNASFPFDFYHRNFMSLNYGFGVSYYDFKLAKESSGFSYMFEDSNLFVSNFNVNYYYNLPWVNDIYHPVQKINTSLSYDYSNEDIGMNRDYWQFKAYNEIAVTPLRELLNIEFLKTIMLQNRTTYRETGGDALVQFLPGVDDSEFIFISGEPAFSRMYLRGYEETLWGKKLLSFQNDLRFKLFDNLSLSLNWQGPLLSSSYLGFSIWTDYTKLFQPDMSLSQDKNRIYKAMGVEATSAWNILGFDTLHRYGHAWDTKNNKLGYYYILEIPFKLF